jgi:hypothetical protein
MRSRSLAALKSAASLPASWASMHVSTIARPILPNSSKPPAPRASTFISRMSAAPCSRRCGRCSMILPVFPSAASSRSTTRRHRCPVPTCFRCCASASCCAGSLFRISPRSKPISCAMSANGPPQISRGHRRWAGEGAGIISWHAERQELRQDAGENSEVSMRAAEHHRQWRVFQSAEKIRVSSRSTLFAVNCVFHRRAPFYPCLKSRPEA